MTKLFMFLCVVITFFGIVGCPSDDPVTRVGQSKLSSAPVTSSQGSSIRDNSFAVPEASTLLMLGSGLLGLAEFGRKRFKRYTDMGRTFFDNGGRRKSQFSYDAHIPERRSGKDRRSGLDRRLKTRTKKE